MADLGTAYVNIVPKAPGIEGELENMFSDATESVGKASGKDIGKNIGKGLAVGTAAVATAAVAVGKTIVSSASDLASYGDNIDKMSQKMGISAQAYQEWDAILQHSGTSIDGMQRGMMTLSNAAANGSEAFQQLGLSQEQVASMSQEDLFSAVITGLQGMEAGSERTALAQQLLGGAAKELGPLLNTSAADTEAMRQRVHELGGVLSDEAVAASAHFQDSLQDMQTAFTGIKNTIAAEFLPGLTDIMDGFTALVAGEEGASEQITQGFDNLFTAASGAIEGVFSIAGELIPEFVGIIVEHLPQLITLGAQLILQLVVGLIGAIPDLLDQIPAIWESLKGAWEAIDWASLGTTLIDRVKSSLSGAGKKLWDGFKDSIDEMKRKFSEVDWSTLGGDIISGIVKGLTGGASSLYKSVKNIIKNALSKGQEEAETGSPSKLFARELGRWIPAGVAMGIDQNMEPLDEAMRGMIDGSLATAKNSTPAAAAAGPSDADRIVSALNRLQLTADVKLEGDAASMLRVVNRTNWNRTNATGYNRLAAVGAR